MVKTPIFVIISLFVFALLFFGCCSSTGPSKEQIIKDFKESTCGHSTMGEAMQEYAAEQGAFSAVVEDAWKDGDGWAVRISHIGSGKTIRFAYHWLPDSKAKFAENDEARALTKICQTK